MDQVTRRHLAAFALGFVLVAQTAAAQSHATVAGRVVSKSAATALIGAEVLLAPGDRRLVTDSAGRFRFDQVAAGNVTILVRLIGFIPDTSYFEVRANEDADVLVELRQSVQPLDTVRVAGREQVLARGKLSGFYERKKFGIGRFLESDIFVKEQNRQLADVITSRAAGTRLVRARLGTTAWIATTRQAGMSGAGLDPTDRLKGADPRACYPDVWLDGVNVYSYGRGQPLFDVSLIGTDNVSAVEVYVGASQTPSQYAKVGSVCGVVLIWTK
jgi:hypothetical protein